MPSWLDAGPGMNWQGEANFGHPAAAFDELGAEVADMGNRAAKRGAAEAEEDQEDIPR